MLSLIRPGGYGEFLLTECLPAEFAGPPRNRRPVSGADERGRAAAASRGSRARRPPPAFLGLY
jgi:hypothetical protein